MGRVRARDAAYTREKNASGQFKTGFYLRVRNIQMTSISLRSRIKEKVKSAKISAKKGSINKWNQTKTKQKPNQFYLSIWHRKTTILAWDKWVCVLKSSTHINSHFITERMNNWANVWAQLSLAYRSISLDYNATFTGSATAIASDTTTAAAADERFAISFSPLA